MCIYWIGTYTCGCVREGLKELCNKAPGCRQPATAERREYQDICNECQGKKDEMARITEMVRCLEGAQNENVEVDQPATEETVQTETDSEEHIEEDAEEQDTEGAPKKVQDTDGKTFLLWPERYDLARGPHPVRRRRGERFPRRGRTYPDDDEWMY